MPLHYILQNINIQDHKLAKKYFNKEDLKEIFAQSVCSTQSAISTVQKFSDEMVAKSDDNKSVTMKISDFKDYMCILQGKKKREIKDERPYTRGLYDYTSHILRPQFVVTWQDDNVKRYETYEPDQINKYATSQADLVIYKAQSSAYLECCPSDPAVSALVAELKLKDKTSYPMWECFHNMLAIRANMATE